ncbi:MULTISPECIES: glycosyltransferase [Alteromonadaceae]|uniref:glycosyltransferase n=1 Tax=Alteromonadaceae TaxID=72275 RepID=UPI003109086A
MSSNPNDTPLVSVVMACYREPVEWLGLAIDSILQQTFINIELIVVIDDPSNIKICDFLAQKQTNDSRLKVLKNQKNIGLPASLNKAVEQSKSQIIARMDADDISLRERLQMQFEYMQANPDVSLIGSAIENIDECGTSLGISHFQSSSEVIQKIIPYCSVACHPTWMFKKSMFDSIGGYRMLQGAEDYDFLYRILDAGGKITNLQQPLLQYRLHGASITSGMNLKRYKVRHYIKALHQQRVTLGKDNYSTDGLELLLSQQQDSPLVASLITKLRKAEARHSITRIPYLLALFFCSVDVRERILDHLKIRMIISTTRT